MNVAGVHGSVLREQTEPHAGYEAVPLWLITLFFCVTFWAGIYLADYNADFRPDVFSPDVGNGAGGGAGTPAGPVDPKVLGRRVYSQNCVVCHQPTGLGVPGQFPPLVGSEWVLGNDWHGDNHLVKILLKGLQGPIQVKGGTFNNAMPPWAQLTDEQIADVLTYVRSEWGNAAPPVTKEFVKTVRDRSTSRSEPWSQKDLRAIPAEKVPAAGGNLPPVPSPSPGPSGPAA